MLAHGVQAIEISIAKLTSIPVHDNFKQEEYDKSVYII